MATERREPFRQALTELRRRLREEILKPGARIAAKEVADDLRLSPTPVREALSRLAGEGLVEDHRGDGFFVPRLTPADIGALYRLSEQLLLFSQTSPKMRYGEAAGVASPVEGDPVRAVERLFWAWAAECDSRVAREAYRNVAMRLAPIRRREAEFIPDLSDEAEGLWRLADAKQAARRPGAVQAFHARRIILAEPLCRIVGDNDLDIMSPI